MGTFHPVAKRTPELEAANLGEVLTELLAQQPWAVTSFQGQILR